jgi:hypothetical protein
VIILRIFRRDSRGFFTQFKNQWKEMFDNPFMRYIGWDYYTQRSIEFELMEQPLFVIIGQDKPDNATYLDDADPYWAKNRWY